MKNIPRPVVHYYNEINPGKFATVRHFELSQTKFGAPCISEHLNIGLNRSFAKSNPDYWVKEKKESKWAKRALTGIWKTRINGFFFGDSNLRENLLIFEFIGERLVVYIYRQFYTRDLLPVIRYIGDLKGGLDRE